MVIHIPTAKSQITKCIITTFWEVYCVQTLRNLYEYIGDFDSEIGVSRG